MKYIYYNMLIWLLASCSFLEEYSQDTVYVRGYQDLEELLVGEGYMSAYAANSLAYQWGYYPYIHYMQDETEECSSDFVNSDYSRKDQIFGYYTWQQRCGVNEQGTSWADESRDWTKLYYHVNIVNNVIDLIDEQITGSEDERLGALRLKGEAYFLRGAYYFTLVNLYGKPYSAATATQDPAVPLKLSGEIQDVVFGRESVAEVYEQILSDLKTAETCLGQTPDPATVYQADSTALHLLLSRVYLYMQNWEQALKYARKVIGVRPELRDLNDFNSGGFLDKSSEETIFSMGGNNIVCNTVNLNAAFQVSGELYDTYDDNDLRKNIFFWKYNNFIGYAKVGAGPGSFGQTPDPDNREYYYFCYAMYYPGTRLGVSDNWLLRTAQAYLNGAEAAAYLGDERTARELLEALRVKRWDREKYEPIQKTGEALVTEIRDERRRELCLEGHRWFDLRRYMVCEKYPFTKEIQKVYYVYDDSGNQIIEKRVYKLEKNDPAYTLPIPYEVLDYNTGMEDNPHPQRSYVSEPFN